MKQKKIRKSYRLSDLTVRRLEAISKKEGKNATEALEFMIQEKADYYGIKMLTKKEVGSGAFPYGAGSSIPLNNPALEDFVQLPENSKRTFKKKIKTNEQ